MHTKTDPSQLAAELQYPWETPPNPGEMIELKPGVLWVRLKLPFRLNHVNIYLLEDGDGWTIVDSGFGNEKSIAAWETLFAGPLKGFQIKKLIVTHSHPDHVGLAGWLVERFDCKFYMTQVEYLQTIYHQNRHTDERHENSRRFFLRHGMDEDLTTALMSRGQDYLKRMAELPAAYIRLTDQQRITIGNREFIVLTGGGHAPEQMMLYCASEKLFLAADQVLSKISPNVSVWAHEPEANALGQYLSSLKRLAGLLPADALVLPGHGVPFYGLHTRIQQLADHHEERCQMIAAACRDVPQTSAQLVPVVFFKHKLDAHQTGFAAGELIAHVNHMLADKRLMVVSSDDGVLRFRTV